MAGLHYHVVGAAGVGMNAVAQVLKGQGFEVTGSDRYQDQGQDLDVIHKLEAAGVLFVPQDGRGVRSDTAGVVVSTAIEPDNPDLQAAARLGVPVLHRAEMLAQLVAGKDCVAVTGTCGKTTVTGLVGYLLEQMGEDPTVVNGGSVVNWVSETAVGNVRIGRSRCWVIEADESDRSCLRFNPAWAVITNCSADHFSVADTEALFAQFARQVSRGLLDGVAEPAETLVRGVETGADGCDFTLDGVCYHVPVLGRHNVENAVHAIRLCRRLGHAPERIRGALAGFRGIVRRLERVGVANGITVVDDYAHNPAKIAAALSAVQPFHRRVLAVWRPHGFGPLAQMLEDLAGTLARVLRPEDRFHVLPVYYAGGTARRSVNSGALVEALVARGVNAVWVPDYGPLAGHLLAEGQPGDVVLSMGARDPELPRFARRLLHALASRSTSSSASASE